jgi:hypothetical protein
MGEYNLKFISVEWQNSLKIISVTIKKKLAILYIAHFFKYLINNNKYWSATTHVFILCRCEI